jgi:hypothetical protein
VSGRHPAAEIDTAVADCMQRARFLLEVAGPDLRIGTGMVGGSACGQRRLNAEPGDGYSFGSDSGAGVLTALELKLISKEICRGAGGAWKAGR